MRTFASRRWAGWTVVLLASALLIAGNQLLWLSFQRPVYISGWLLLAMVVFLAAFNLRKKMPFLPIGSASTWLQVHIYVGLLSIVVFGLHLALRVPNGLFEVCLASCFAIVALSGILGLILSRVLASRLAAREGEILWDRIPRMRGLVSRDTERLALDCLAKTESAAVVDYYMRRLRSYFAGPRHFWSHLMNSSRPLRKLLGELEAHKRYLNDAEKEFMVRIAERVKVKDDLDYHYSLQAVLKYWLFLHVPLTYALIMFSVVHVTLIHAF